MERGSAWYSVTNDDLCEEQEGGAISCRTNQVCLKPKSRLFTLLNPGLYLLTANTNWHQWWKTQRFLDRNFLRGGKQEKLGPKRNMIHQLDHQQWSFKPLRYVNSVGISVN